MKLTIQVFIQWQGSAQGSLGGARHGGGSFEEGGEYRFMTHLRSMWARIEIIGEALD